MYNSLQLEQKYARKFVRGHYLFRKAQFSKSYSRSENLSFVLIFLQIFFATRSFENWGISLGYSPILVEEYPVT